MIISEKNIYLSDLLLISSEYRCCSALYLHSTSKAMKIEIYPKLNVFFALHTFFLDTHIEKKTWMSDFTNWTADCDLIFDSSWVHQWPNLTSWRKREGEGRREREKEGEREIEGERERERESIYYWQILLSKCIHILPCLVKYQLHPHDSKMETIQVEQKLKVTWRNCFTYLTLKIKFGGLRTRLNTLSVENRRKPGDLTNRSSGPSIVIGRAFVSRQCISSANESTSHLLSVSECVCVCVCVCMCMCMCTCMRVWWYSPVQTYLCFLVRISEQTVI